MSDTFYVNRGTDLIFSFNWPDGAGGNANLTGFTVSAFGADPYLEPYLTVTLANPATGLINGRVEWNNSFPESGPLGFRVRVTQGSNDTTTNLLKVVYQ
jgi:hypothetical protein